jgi:hypothetical protein
MKNKIDYLMGLRPNEIRFAFDQNNETSQGYRDWMNDITLKNSRVMEENNPYYNKSLRMTYKEAVLEVKRQVANLIGETKACEWYAKIVAKYGENGERYLNQ